MEDAGMLGPETYFDADFTELEKAVPCKICGNPTLNTGTELCNGCWEVQSRIDDYLRHPKGYDDVVARVVKARLTKKDRNR